MNQLTYAAADVLYLVSLTEKLEKELDREMAEAVFEGLDEAEIELRFHVSFGHPGPSAPDLFTNLRHQVFWQFTVLGVEITEAGFSTDNKTGGHVDADLGHLAEVCTFAAQQLFVLAVTFFE